MTPNENLPEDPYPNNPEVAHTPNNPDAPGDKEALAAKIKSIQEEKRTKIQETTNPGFWEKLKAALGLGKKPATPENTQTPDNPPPSITPSPTPPQTPTTPETPHPTRLQNRSPEEIEKLFLNKEILFPLEEEKGITYNLTSGECISVNYNRSQPSLTIKYFDGLEPKIIEITLQELSTNLHNPTQKVLNLFDIQNEQGFNPEKTDTYLRQHYPPNSIVNVPRSSGEITPGYIVDYQPHEDNPRLKIAVFKSNTKQVLYKSIRAFPVEGKPNTSLAELNPRGPKVLKKDVAMYFSRIPEITINQKGEYDPRGETFLFEDFTPPVGGLPGLYTYKSPNGEIFHLTEDKLRTDIIPKLRKQR